MKFYDTNALLELQSDIFNERFAISSMSLVELEEIKSHAKKDEGIKYKARQIARLLIENQNDFEVIVVDKAIEQLVDMLGLSQTPDNIICACAKCLVNGGNAIEFVSYDIACNLIANKVFGLNTVCYENKIEDVDYKGYKIVTPDDDMLAKVYEKDNAENIFDCEINEYVIVEDNNGNFCDVLKWTGEKYASVWNKGFKSRQFGTIKPLDEYQRMAFDSIVNNDITVLFGRAGSGKTTIPLSFIMQSLESGKYKKCQIIHSFDTLKGQKTLGYVKGSQLEKILQTGSIGNILASKLGDAVEVERLIASGQLEIIPTANIRGVELSELVFCTESQNLDTYTLKTLIQRCKTGCKVILEGDILEQNDTSRGVGLFRLLEVFKGYKRFGCVKLKNNYRDEMGELADLL